MKKLIYAMLLGIVLCACKKDDNYMGAESWVVASETRMGYYVPNGYGPKLVVKSPGAAEWEQYFDRNEIEGFEWEEGYECEVRIRVYRVDNPPADGSSLRYVLDEVVSKTRKDSVGLPDDAPLPPGYPAAD